MFAGIDTGYGFTKVVYGDNETFLFKTAVEPYIRSEKRFGGRPDVITVRDKSFIVGPDSDLNWQVTKDFIGSEQYYAVIGYCLHKIHTITGKALTGMALGLPPAMFNERKTILLTEELHRAGLMANGKAIAIPQKVVFVPQAVGAYIDFISSNPGYASDNVVVIDIGYYTLDVVFLRQGRFVPDASKSYPSGVEFLLEKISDEFTNRYGLFINRALAETILKKGALVDFGKEYKFNVEEILHSYYIPKIISRIKEYAFYLRKRFETDTIKAVVIAGGGAVYVKDMLDGATVLPEPQFANARGYKIYIEQQG